MVVRQRFLIATSSIEQHGYKGRRTPADGRRVDPAAGTRREKLEKFQEGDF